jgi:Holliday junction resolvasome RuvABC DNA-binding subunit
VQWHAETLVGRESHRSLFEELVSVAADGPRLALAV